MEDIKVREYVRTTEGYIGKIYKIDRKNFEETGYFIDNKQLSREQQGFPIAECRIKKHSFKLAGLAEPGDIGVMDCYGFQVKKFLTQDDILGLKIGEYELLSIVTKEQFDREKYVVEVNNG